MLRCSTSPYHEVRCRSRALPDTRFHPLLYLRNFRLSTLANVHRGERTIHLVRPVLSHPRVRRTRMRRATAERRAVQYGRDALRGEAAKADRIADVQLISGGSNRAVARGKQALA